MKYTMTTPCDACPFLIGSGFTWRSLTEHASGEFGCHKACNLDDETGMYEPRTRKHLIALARSYSMNFRIDLTR